MVMEYDGYVGVVEFDATQRLLHGRIVNMRDMVTFEGRTVEELETALHDSVEDYRDFCVQRGVAPEKPVSGTMLLRLGAELHRDVIVAATRAKKSVNKYVKEVLAERVHADAH